MRDITTKTDGSSTLTGPEFNSSQNELENAVTQTGQTLDSAAGPDTDAQQLARANVIIAQGAGAYDDGGAANTFVLTAKRATFVQPEAYTDGMTVSFTAAATNTGAATINVSGLGSLNFRKAGGGTHAAGEIGAGNFIVAQYIESQNRFEEVSNTTPDAAGPASPDQVAVYADSGSATGITLTIEPGYIQPTAFTDQMVVIFKANATNNGTGTHQINISGLGSRDVVETDGSDPIAGRLPAGAWITAIFREVRNEFEIAYVSDRPKTAASVPALVTSSSGSVYNLDSVPEVNAPTAYTDGMVIIFRVPERNTGSVNLNLNGIGSRSIRRGQGGSTLANGELLSNAGLVVQYDAAQDFFRIVSNGTRRERFTRALINTPQNILQNGETEIDFATPERDDAGFYRSVTQDFQVPANRGIQLIDVNFFINTDTIPSGEAVSASIRRVRGGNEVAIGGGVIFQGGGTNQVTISVDNIEVQDDDVISVFTATTNNGNIGILTGSLSITVKAFAGE